MKEWKNYLCMQDKKLKDGKYGRKNEEIREQSKTSNIQKDVWHEKTHETEKHSKEFLSMNTQDFRV